MTNLKNLFDFPYLQTLVQNNPKESLLLFIIVFTTVMLITYISFLRGALKSLGEARDPYSKRMKLDTAMMYAGKAARVVAIILFFSEAALFTFLYFG